MCACMHEISIKYVGSLQTYTCKNHVWINTCMHAIYICIHIRMLYVYMHAYTHSYTSICKCEGRHVHTLKRVHMCPSAQPIRTYHTLSSQMEASPTPKVVTFACRRNAQTTSPHQTKPSPLRRACSAHTPILCIYSASSN